MMKRRQYCKSSRQRQRHLPEDMIFQILSWLSAESLCRFRSVSRLLQSMIDSPFFVSAHRARSYANPKLLLCQYDDMGDSHVFSTAYPMENNVKDASSCWRSHGRTPACVFASEGGFLCSYDHDRKEIHVSNPITGERISFRTLPISESKVGTPFYAVCFGYDPVENKHKVLIVWTHLVSRKIILTVDIFTLGGTGGWRRMINPTGLPDLLLFLCPIDHTMRMKSICIEGTIYIIGMDSDSKSWLVSFDVRMETLRAIPVPAEASLGMPFCLLGFGGAPAFIEKPYHLLHEGEGELIKIRLWILDDFCRRLWSCREFLLPSISYPVAFAGITSHGEVILSHNTPEEPTITLYFYRLENSTIKTIYRLNAVQPEVLTAFYHIENLQPIWYPLLLAW